MSKHVCKTDQMKHKLIRECRKNRYPTPKSGAKSNASPNLHEVVKVDLIPNLEREPIQLIGQNVSFRSTSFLLQRNFLWKMSYCTFLMVLMS